MEKEKYHQGTEKEIEESSGGMTDAEKYGTQTRESLLQQFNEGADNIGLTPEERREVLNSAERDRGAVFYSFSLHGKIIEIRTPLDDWGDDDDSPYVSIERDGESLSCLRYEAYVIEPNSRSRRSKLPYDLARQITKKYFDMVYSAAYLKMEGKFNSIDVYRERKKFKGGKDITNEDMKMFRDGAREYEEASTEPEGQEEAISFAKKLLELK